MATNRSNVEPLQQTPTSLSTARPAFGSTFFADVIAGRPTDQLASRQGNVTPRTVAELPPSQVAQELSANAQIIQDRIEALRARQFTAEDFRPGATAPRLIQKVFDPVIAQRKADRANELIQDELTELIRLQKTLAAELRLQDPRTTARETAIGQAQAEAILGADPSYQMAKRQAQEIEAENKEFADAAAGRVKREQEMAYINELVGRGVMTPRQADEAMGALLGYDTLSAKDYVEIKERIVEEGGELDDESLKAVYGSIVWQNDDWTDVGKAVRTDGRRLADKRNKVLKDKAKMNAISAGNTAFTSITNRIQSRIKSIKQENVGATQARDENGAPIEIRSSFGTPRPFFIRTELWPQNGVLTSSGTRVYNEKDYVNLEYRRALDQFIEDGGYPQEFLNHLGNLMGIVSDKELEEADLAKPGIDAANKALLSAYDALAAAGDEASAAKARSLRQELGIEPVSQGQPNEQP